MTDVQDTGMLPGPYPWLPRLQLSYSSLSTLNSCDQKFEFQKMLRIPRRDVSFDGEVGHAMHEGYGEFLRTGGNEEAALFKMMLHYPYELMDEYPINAEKKSLETCYASMNALFTSANLASYEVANINVGGEERAAIEVPFTIEIKGFELDPDRHIPITYVGFIDAILFDYVTETYKVVDLKTHRDNMDDLTAKYAKSEQVIPYGFVTQQMIDPSINSFDASFISCYMDIENPKVREYEFPKSNADITDWARGLYIDLCRIRTFYQMGWWKRNGNACMNWRRPCPFFDQCHLSTPETRRQQFIINEEPKLDEEFPAWVRLELELAA